MNKQFAIKMLHAKQLEYEALKEIMPENMANRIIKIENDLMDIGKEYFMDNVRSAHKENQSATTRTNSKTRKVTIE